MTRAITRSTRASASPSRHGERADKSDDHVGLHGGARSACDRGWTLHAPDRRHRHRSCEHASRPGHGQPKGGARTHCSRLLSLCSRLLCAAPGNAVSPSFRSRALSVDLLCLHSSTLAGSTRRHMRAAPSRRPTRSPPTRATWRSVSWAARRTRGATARPASRT